MILSPGITDTPEITSRPYTSSISTPRQLCANRYRPKDHCLPRRVDMTKEAKIKEKETKLATMIRSSGNTRLATSVARRDTHLTAVADKDNDDSKSKTSCSMHQTKDR